MIGALRQRKINIRFTPKIPAETLEVFYIIVGHFEPVRMRIKAIGMYPMLFFNLPIVKSKRFIEIEKELMKKGLVKKKTKRAEELKDIKDAKDPSISQRALIYQEVER